MYEHKVSSKDHLEPESFDLGVETGSCWRTSPRGVLEGGTLRTRNRRPVRCCAPARA